MGTSFPRANCAVWMETTRQRKFCGLTKLLAEQNVESDDV